MGSHNMSELFLKKFNEWKNGNDDEILKYGQEVENDKRRLYSDNDFEYDNSSLLIGVYENKEYFKYLNKI